MARQQHDRLALAAAMGFCLAANAALATENSGLEYPIGVNTILAGALPPPNGSVWLDYNQFYSAGRLNGPNGKPLVPGFHINVFASAARFLHTWDVPLGPFTLTSGFVQPLVYIGGKVGGAKDHSFGLGDVALQPLYLGYTSPTHDLFAFAGVDVYFPTGAYDKGHLFNQGLNIYTFQPQIVLTYLPTPKLELDVAATWEVHTTNPATNYHSGASFDFDYAISYKVSERFPNLSLGVQGYVFQQFTDDTVNGGKVLSDGFRGRAFAAGPQVAYGIGHGGLAIKYEREFLVQNRPEGNKFWAQFAVPF